MKFSGALPAKRAYDLLERVLKLQTAVKDARGQDRPRASPNPPWRGPLIETERLLIRRMRPDDLADYLAYQSDPAVREHQPGEPMTADYARDYLAEQAGLDERRLGKWHGFAVEHLADHRMIGDIGVFLQVEPALSGDTGFQFHPAYHRQGYGLEAMAPFLMYLFEGLGLREVTANCDAGNLASQALIGRLGLHRLPGDKMSYRLSREDWLAAG